MIGTLEFAIGFIIYIVYTQITFNIYLKNNQISTFLTLIVIFIFYSLLAGYLIFLVDYNSTFSAKLIQTLIYIIAGGFYQFFNFKDKVKINEDNILNVDRM